MMMRDKAAWQKQFTKLKVQYCPIFENYKKDTDRQAIGMSECQGF